MNILIHINLPKNTYTYTIEITYPHVCEYKCMWFGFYRFQNYEICESDWFDIGGSWCACRVFVLAWESTISCVPFSKHVVNFYVGVLAEMKVATKE